MNPKPFYTSKTLWLNLVLILTSVFTLATTTFELSGFELKVMMFVVGVLGILNRFLSTGSSDLTAKK